MNRTVLVVVMVALVALAVTQWSWFGIRRFGKRPRGLAYRWETRPVARKGMQ